MAAKHTPPQDASFRTSLLRHLGGGVALVALVAVAFYGIGQVGQEPGTPIAADQPDDEDVPEEVDEPEADDEDEPEEPEPEEPEESDESEEAEEPEPDEPEEADDSADEAEEPEEADDAPAFAPADVSVQVLDGVGTDGGAAAGQMAQRLRGEGYDIIAENPSLAYQTTTVLWTSGNEDKARQVAAQIGAGEVRAQPGNLSESVDVHVVVGADRA